MDKINICKAAFKFQRMVFFSFCVLACISDGYLYADTAGPNSPSTTVDDATVGNTAWNNPNNTQTSNNVYATAGNSPMVRFRTSYIKLVKGGVISGTAQTGTIIFPGSEAITPISQTLAQWNVALTPDDVNAADFGVAVSAFDISGEIATHYLKATDFGFSIPSDATINGVIVSIEGKYGSACFIAGTLIDTLQGKIPIEKIRKGMMVTAFDERSEKIVLAKISSILVGKENPRTTDELVIIHAEDATVSVTLEHPFYTFLGQWIKAKEIQEGQILKIMKNGILEDSKVLKVEKIKVKQVPIYNFEVEKYHTYVANGFVVHNKIFTSSFDHVTITVDYTPAEEEPPPAPSIKAHFGGGRIGGGRF